MTTETNPEAADGAATDSAQMERAVPEYRADDRTDGLIAQVGLGEQPERIQPAAGPGVDFGAEGDVDAGAETGDEPDEGTDGYEADVDDEHAEDDEESDGEARAGLTRGIWWAAVLLPFLSVVGAILCFAAGVLNSGACEPVGSALCSGSGQWFTFGLPLLIAPLVAAVTAIGGVVVHRHRSSWLAVGYFVVFVSVLIGLASANSGGS